MKAVHHEIFSDLVRRIAAVLTRRPNDELATRAWTLMFNGKVTVPADIEADMNWLASWFSERIDGLAPAMGKSCNEVISAIFTDVLDHVAAAECSLPTVKDMYPISASDTAQRDQAYALAPEDAFHAQLGVVYSREFQNRFWDGDFLLATFDEPADMFVGYQQEDDATIAEHRHPRATDRVLARLGEAPTGNLPDDAELDQLGVDRAVLANHLRNGLDARLFKRALRAGVVNVDGFNCTFDPTKLNDLLTMAVEHARDRRGRRNPVNRVLQHFAECI